MAQAQRPMLSEWSGELTTSGGVRLHIRPATAEDEDLLVDFFSAMI